MDSELDYLLEQCAARVEETLGAQIDKAESTVSSWLSGPDQYLDRHRLLPPSSPPTTIGTDPMTALLGSIQRYPPPVGLWRGTHGIATGRISLPSPYTASISSITEQPNAHHPSEFVSRLQSNHAQVPASTPITNNCATPSSSTGLRSSPLVDANRRRTAHLRQTTIPLPPNIVRCTPPTLPALKPGQGSQIHREGEDRSIATPLVQGIKLISTNELPDRFRSLFPYPLFNAIQSKCFHTIFKTDENLVLAAPTGGGKTAVLELAICRLLSTSPTKQFKIVYQAPTKSLCAERQRDWQPKFAALDLQCAELTGDTDQAQLHHVQNASIIITTPEKWDSITRRWKDHMKLMQMVRLFLIDEVHILKESRGATLEAVVSRMKSVGSNVRCIALSATVPNSEDIATWLGRDPSRPQLPAHREHFGEEFRPVRLKKHVYGYQCNGNEFAFDKTCEAKLPAVITKHSSQKPIMVFCCTRNSAMTTAKQLGKWWAISPRERQWPAPSQRLSMKDKDLQDCALAGVAFHHAGLESGDRQCVERAYLEGHISVICCTSTLAVGVNLPCHLVILKNTVSWQNGSLRECADLEIMQMLGRAGRPQFDTTGVAVIMTRSEKVQRYERMVTGEDLLESCLHLNLIEHLNAEVSLGTVSDMRTAVRWLQSTFLYVRLSRNPDHYKLGAEGGGDQIDARLEQIIARDIDLLQEAELMQLGQDLRCTEYGDTMARSCLKFATMRIILSLPRKAEICDILAGLVMAEEFKDVRFKAADKALYKELNAANGIRYPINVDLALPAHKVSIIIQSELGGIDYPADEQFQKHRVQFQTDRSLVFQHAHRLIRCITDCQLHRDDAVATRNSLELTRSLAARVWDNSPLQMKQVDQIGVVAVRKLSAAGVDSIEALAATEAHRIETILSRNPPFGHKILTKMQAFPRLTIAAKVIGKEVKTRQSVRVHARMELGFSNRTPPTAFNRKPLFVTYLCETSDGDVVDFGRISARKLNGPYEVLFTARLSRSGQNITASVMFEEIAGSLRQIILTPEVAASCFPQPAASERMRTIPTVAERPSRKLDLLRSTDSISNSGEGAMIQRRAPVDASDHDTCDEEIFESALGDLDFDHIDGFYLKLASQTQKNTKANRISTMPQDATSEMFGPVRKDNGKWACNHRCKDKTVCKHLCCRDGTEKPPKASHKEDSGSTRAASSIPTGFGTTTSSSKRSQGRHIRKSDNDTRFLISNTVVKHPDVGRDGFITGRSPVSSPSITKLDQLHASILKASPMTTVKKRKANLSDHDGNAPELSFFRAMDRSETQVSSSSNAGLTGLECSDDFPSLSALVEKSSPVPTQRRARSSSDTSQYGDALSLDETLMSVEKAQRHAAPADNIERVTAMAGWKRASGIEFGVGDVGLQWSSSPNQRTTGFHLPSVVTPAGQRTLARASGSQSLFVHDSSSTLVPTSAVLYREAREKRLRANDGDSPSRRPLLVESEDACNLDLRSHLTRPTKRVCLSDYGWSSSGSCPSSPTTSIAVPRHPVNEVVTESLNEARSDPELESIDPDVFAEFGDLVEFI